MEVFLNIIGIIVAFAFIICFLFLLPINMAKERGRNPIGWTIIVWILTPFWGAIILAVLGDSTKKIKQDILDEINRNRNEQ